MRDADVTGTRWDAPLVLVLSVAAVALVALGHPLFAGALHPLDDCTYAAAARNAWEHGAWLPLRYDGHAFYQHGPLVPWSMAALFGAFGVHEAWARLPSVLAALGTVALVFAAARAEYAQRAPTDRQGAWLAGLLAAGVLLTTEAFLRFSGRARLDAPLTFAMLLSAYGVLRAMERPLAGYLLAGLGAGLAVCAKGAAGVVALPAVLFAILLARRGRDLARPAAYWGLALAVALPAPWLGYLLIQDGDAYTRGYVIGFVGEALSQGRGMAPQSTAYYLWFFLETYWPWLPLLLVALVAQVRDGLARRPISPFAVFAVVFGLALAVPRTKYPHYAMPLYPLFAVLLGVAGARWLATTRARQWAVRLWYGLGALGIAALLAFPGVMHRSALGAAFRSMGPAVRERTREEKRIAFTTGLDRWEVVAGLEFYARRLTANAPLSLDAAAQLLRSGGGVVVAPAEAARAENLAPFAAAPCGVYGALALLCPREAPPKR